MTKERKLQLAEEFVQMIKKCKDDAQLLELSAVMVDKFEQAVKSSQLPKLNIFFDIDAQITKLNTPERYNKEKLRYDYSESDIRSLFDIINRPNELDLNFCPNCIQMTNHQNGICKKCNQNNLLLEYLDRVFK